MFLNYFSLGRSEEKKNAIVSTNLILKHYSSVIVISYSRWKKTCQRNYAFHCSRKYEVLNYLTSHIEIHQNSIQKELRFKILVWVFNIHIHTVIVSRHCM